MTFAVEGTELTPDQAQTITNIYEEWDKPYTLIHTPKIPITISVINPSKKRKSLGYITDLGFKKGDKIVCFKDLTKTVEILNDKQVIQNGKIVSLSRATINALGSNYKGYSGIKEWTYNGEILYNRAKRMGLI